MIKKTFISHEFPLLERIDSETGDRMYKAGEFKYPSVTSVTGLHSREGIEAWRKKVGPAEAARIGGKASRRGNAIHSLCESYIKVGFVKTPEEHREMFKAMRPKLDLIDNIHCLESKLVSHKLKVAGTVDCIGEFDKKLSVIDFKTSLRPKIEEWVQGYFMQTAAYAFMFWELTDIMVEESVIVIGVDGGQVQVFKAPIVKWLKRFRVLREQYRQEKGV